MTYLVFAVVLLVEELGHRLDGIAVVAVDAGGGKGHGDYAPGYVAQVQVVAVLLVAALVFAHGQAKRLLHAVGEQEEADRSGQGDDANEATNDQDARVAYVPLDEGKRINSISIIPETPMGFGRFFISTAF